LLITKTLIRTKLTGFKEKTKEKTYTGINVPKIIMKYYPKKEGV